MSTFLDALERELLAAHPRRRSARRRAVAGRVVRGAALAALILALLGGAGAFVLSVGREAPGGSAAPGLRPAPTVPAVPAPSEPVLRAPLPAADRRTPVAVLNGTTQVRLAAGVASFLASAHRIGTVGDAARADVTETSVTYAPAARIEATAIAGALGLPAPAPRDQPTGRLSGDAGVTVIVGSDIEAAGVAPLRRAARGDATGKVDYVRFGDRIALTLTANLASPQGRGYALWLGGGGQDAVFLGWLPLGRRGASTRASATLPVPAGRRRRLVISDERRHEAGTAPARPVLLGDL